MRRPVLVGDAERAGRPRVDLHEVEVLDAAPAQRGLPVGVLLARRGWRSSDSPNSSAGRMPSCTVHDRTSPVVDRHDDLDRLEPAPRARGAPRPRGRPAVAGRRTVAEPSPCPVRAGAGARTPPSGSKRASPGRSRRHARISSARDHVERVGGGGHGLPIVLRSDADDCAAATSTAAEPSCQQVDGVLHAGPSRGSRRPAGCCCAPSSRAAPGRGGGAWPRPPGGTERYWFSSVRNHPRQ